MEKKNIFFILFGILLIVGVTFLFLQGPGTSEELLTAQEKDSIVSQAARENTTNLITNLPSWIIEKTGAEENLDIKYEVFNDTYTEFCVGYLDEDQYKQDSLLSGRNVSNVPTTTISKDKNVSLETNIDLSNSKNELNKEVCFGVSYPEWRAGMDFKIGWNTAIVNSTNSGLFDSREAFNQYAFGCNTNNRVYVSYIDSGGNLHTQSANASDISSWTDGVDIFAEAGMQYEEYATISKEHDGECFLHATYGMLSEDILHYRRCLLNETSPHTFCDAEQIVWENSEEGGENADFITTPSIALDDNNCVFISAADEDDSQGGPDKFLSAWKENNTSPHVCGDGLFNSTDQASGSPFRDIISASGYGGGPANKIVSYETGDMQVIWFDMSTSLSNNINLLTSFYNATSNNFEEQLILFGDTEFNFATFAYGDAVTFGTSFLAIVPNDTQTLLSAYKISTLNGTTVTNSFPAISAQVGAGLSASYTAVVDTRSPGGDDVYIFSINNTDPTQMYVVNSSDGGETWGDITLFFEEGGSVTGLRLPTAVFFNDTCEIILRYHGTISGGVQISAQNMTTNSCEGEVDGPPAITLNFPLNNTASTNTSYIFDFNASDDQQIDNITLTVFNSTGIFNQTINTTTGTAISYLINISNFIPNVYTWNVVVVDNASQSTTSENFTLTVNAGDSCTCVDGVDWDVDLSDSCRLDTPCAPNLFNFTSTGNFSCNATLNYSSINDVADNQDLFIESGCFMFQR